MGNDYWRPGDGAGGYVGTVIPVAEVVAAVTATSAAIQALPVATVGSTLALPGILVMILDITSVITKIFWTRLNESNISSKSYPPS